MSAEYSCSCAWLGAFGAILVVLIAVAACNGQQPEIVNWAAIGDESFGLGVRPHTNGWVSVESSADLQTWSEVASLATTNEEGLFVDEVDVHAGVRLYRLKQPGVTVEEAEERWPGGSKLGYRFQIERSSANTLVTNGLKVVSEATADGQPLGQPDPADFPSVEELFAALRAAQSVGCRLVYGLYDPTLGFPVRCLIDQRVAAVPPANPGDAVEYRISGLELLGAPASAKRLPNQR